ncbi:hypothetical protein KJ632_02760 [Patescibacteria group bacterium]|nr:hypothetical protein [Patescibacteria group bacterium]
MNKKRLLILVFFIVIIILALLWFFQSCEPRVKEEETAIPRTEEEDDIYRTYYNAFINANADFTCQLIKLPELKESSDPEDVKAEVRKTYEKYGLPVHNNAIMVSLLKRFENDQEITATIKNNSAPCKEGGEPIILE